MKRILVTNDDGVRSAGIRVLADALAPLGEVIILAPLREASAVGHALTLIVFFVLGRRGLADPSRRPVVAHRAAR